MPLDALCLSEVTRELSALLPGSRVDKVQQPERDLVVLHLRGTAGAVRLLLSAGNGTARIHLTRQELENPAEPPMFCMVLRKHLARARLLSLEQPAWERMVLLTFACLDELGEASEKKLAVEMMGRNANLILIDGAGRILDCLRKADPMTAPKRPLLPGLFYELPPAQEKPYLFETTEEDFIARARESDGSLPADEWLVRSFAGVSPLLARELAFRADGDWGVPLARSAPEKLWQVLRDLRAQAPEPVLLLRNGRPADFYCRPLRQYGHAAAGEKAASFSELLDAYYTEREREYHRQQRSQALLKLVKNRRERAARKLSVRIEERRETAGRETWRQYGDLIKANLYRMRRGDKVLEAENFYDPENAVVRVPLEAKLSPQQNAARYYKLYAKAKNAEKVLTEQIAEAEQELEYLESVQAELELASGERDLAEIRQELTEQGFLRETDKRKRRREAAPKPLRFRTPSGAVILVGRNNLQTDWLTLKHAGKDDLWFHVQKAHGSHAVVSCSPDDRETVTAAALLAAWYSSARQSANVPVDFTRVRFVRKPAGARPGMVIYTNQRTVFATPDRAAVEKLEKLK